MQAQTVFKIADYKMFPPEMEILDIKPDIVEWGVGGSYLLLDKINHQLVSVGSLSGIQMVGGFGRKAVSFSEPIWVGVAPDGILLIDRLENKIILLDYRLTYMYDISLEPDYIQTLLLLIIGGLSICIHLSIIVFLLLNRRHLFKTPISI